MYPLMYSGMKGILDKSFSSHFIFDQRAVDELKFPSASVLVGIK